MFEWVTIGIWCSLPQTSCTYSNVRANGIWMAPSESSTSRSASCGRSMVLSGKAIRWNRCPWCLLWCHVAVRRTMYTAVLSKILDILDEAPVVKGFTMDVVHKFIYLQLYVCKFISTNYWKRINSNHHCKNRLRTIVFVYFQACGRPYAMCFPVYSSVDAYFTGHRLSNGVYRRWAYRQPTRGMRAYIRWSGNSWLFRFFRGWHPESIPEATWKGRCRMPAAQGAILLCTDLFCYCDNSLEKCRFNLATDAIWYNLIKSIVYTRKRQKNIKNLRSP